MAQDDHHETGTTFLRGLLQTSDRWRSLQQRSSRPAPASGLSVPHVPEEISKTITAELIEMKSSFETSLEKVLINSPHACTSIHALVVI